MLKPWYCSFKFAKLKRLETSFTPKSSNNFSLPSLLKKSAKKNETLQNYSDLVNCDWPILKAELNALSRQILYFVKVLRRKRSQTKNSGIAIDILVK